VARSVRGKVRVPDAVRHSSCRSAEPGPSRTPALGSVPVLRSSASQELRAASRPGKASVTRMSAATCGFSHCPAYRCAHAGYLLPRARDTRTSVDSRNRCHYAVCIALVAIQRVFSYVGSRRRAAPLLPSIFLCWHRVCFS
jgi:hypothetical protein